MKYSFFFIAGLLCLATSSFAQMPDTLRRRDPGGWEFIQVRRGNLVMSEGKTHQGLREGVWTEFWENMLPHTLTSFTKGKKNGTYVELRRTGQVEKLISYTSDLPDGPSRTYFPGANMAEETYYSKGVRSGWYTRWYLNGPMQEHSNYNHNVHDGKSTFYRENGQKLAEYTYDRGKLEGDAATYGDNGNVTESGFYSNDQKTGIWKEFYPDGKLKSEGMYQLGEKKGKWKQWDEKGNELR
ncbi:MAG: toxin-antitoxin system YwqK family antitoxin [Bacteroidetes bacterium]|nr:toxin-antitoxin system YwqK family antitoxin [Bacteroidota bacterium]MBS1630218.1 toxin-antitoxin system YwqK family antitoxin [Bacteroidota bacterium]